MKSSTSLLRPFLAALTLLAVPGAAAFTQSHERTIEQLASRADVIAVGTVTDVRSGWDAGGTRVFTEVTLAVSQYLKGGSEESTLTFVTPGGEVGDAGEWYSHAPRFSRNEQVVVFTERDRKGDLRVTGGEQGKISVRSEERSGRSIVGNGEVLEAFTTRIRRASAATPRQ